jgi:hypothetical protein
MRSLGRGKKKSGNFTGGVGKVVTISIHHALNGMALRKRSAG